MEGDAMSARASIYTEFWHWAEKELAVPPAGLAAWCDLCGHAGKCCIVQIGDADLPLDTKQSRIRNSARLTGTPHLVAYSAQESIAFVKEKLNL